MSGDRIEAAQPPEGNPDRRQYAKAEVNDGDVKEDPSQGKGQECLDTVGRYPE